MERKIGDIFVIDRKEYMVVESDDGYGCIDCAFNEKIECFSGQMGYCSDGARTDNKNVHFIKIRD